MTIVNSRSGRVIAMVEDGKYNSIVELIKGEGYTLEPATRSVLIGGKVIRLYKRADNINRADKETELLGYVEGEKHDETADEYIAVYPYRHSVYDVAAEVEMKYSEYKRNHEDCKTKKGSYNPETKTITVYVQKWN